MSNVVVVAVGVLAVAGRALGIGVGFLGLLAATKTVRPFGFRFLGVVEGDAGAGEGCSES